MSSQGIDANIESLLYESNSNLKAKNFDQAFLNLKRALELNSDIPEVKQFISQALFILGSNYLEERNVNKAIESFEAVLRIDPSSEKAHGMLASSCMMSGQIDKAIEYQKKQIAISPQSRISHNNLVAYLHYSLKHKPEDILEAAEAFYKNCYPEFVDAKYSFDHLDLDPKKTKLRIGFVSGDFKKHPLFYWVRGVFAGLQKNGHEVIAFCNNEPDVASELLKQEFNAWRNIRELQDAEVADLVKSEKVDILVDFSGHTALNRLGVFIRKPAPVQVTWLGFSAPTGVPQIDYAIVDNGLVAQGEEALYSEKIYRMPKIFAAIWEPDFDVPTEEAPVLKNKHITFGCFNNFAKLNDAVHQTWAAILKQVPDSKLFLKSKLLRHENFKETIVKKYADHGIASERLLLERDDEDKVEYLKAYNRVDISLNPFPLGGATVANDTLWMSTPIIAMNGNHMSHKNTANFLNLIDCPELIAEDREAYITKAVELATDIDRIKKYKLEIRSKYCSSPVCDMEGFTHDLAQAFREIWSEKLEEKNELSS